MAPRFFTLTAREARAHACILAGVLWIAAAVLLLGGSGRRDPLGGLKGADFVHFYTLGAIALERDAAPLYDLDRLHARQVALVPESAPEAFVPVYGPQTALAFAPFAALPYGPAALAWGATTVLAYGWVVWLAGRRSGLAGADPILLAAAAAGFPPFWNLVLHGQTTVFPLLGFAFAWLALEHGRPLAAGLALGLAALKPQFGLAVAIVMLLRREWRVLAGGAVALVLQAAAVSIYFGPEVLGEYAATIARLPDLRLLLEPRPYQLHSVRALTGLLPPGWDTAVWAAAGLAILVATTRAWRRDVPPAGRMGVLVMASVLVSPHLTIYDATVLVLPIVWLGGLALDAPPPTRARFWGLVYLLFVVFLVPVALVTGVQVSVIVLAALFLLAVRLIEPRGEGPAASAR